MKTVKILLATLILAISLPFSASSQTISIDSKKISFDSLAAESLMLDIEVRESIIQLYADELERKDSAINVTTTRLFATNDSLQYWKGKYYTDMKTEQKEKRLWQKLSIGATILVFFISVF